MTEVDPIDLKRALLVPSAVFESPAAVVTAEGRTYEQRIEILRRWEFDARAMRVGGEAEGAAGGGDHGPPLLDRIRAALRELGVGNDDEEQRAPGERNG